MATVSKKIADEIIANNGFYPGDPQVVKVVKYQNDFNGADAYALVYPGEDPMRYERSVACHNVVVLWSR